MDAIVVAEPEEKNEAYKALTGSFEIPYEEWNQWSEKLEQVSAKQLKKYNSSEHYWQKSSKRKSCRLKRTAEKNLDN